MIAKWAQTLLDAAAGDCKRRIPLDIFYPNRGNSCTFFAAEWMPLSLAWGRRCRTIRF